MTKKFDLKKIYIGVDVGGTSIKYGVFDSNKKFVTKFSTPTYFREKNAEKLIVKDIFDGIKNFFKNNKYGLVLKNIDGIGYAIPGPVVNNKVLRAVNINWKKKFDLVEATKKEFGKKTKVCVYNDANAAAIGEYNVTLKGKYKSICLMTLGTAVGIGIIINGKLIEGKSGIAGELSHLKVDFSDEAIKCNCGNTGCLETVTGGKGISNVYNRLFHPTKPYDAREVVELAKANDEKALRALENSLDYLSTVISIIMLVYEPEVILIGGGVSMGGKFITDIINRRLKNKVFITNKFPKIVLAKLKNQAGFYGAVLNL